ncbi:MAG: glycosyltransferase [Clostridia bacterium]|nr:glycosyltransferase [Clostridia bacterium]
MKILIATDGYKFNTGGITASVLALCSGLRKKGHEVKVLSPSGSHKSFRDGDDYFIKSVPAFYYPGMRAILSFHDPLIKELEAWCPDVNISCYKGKYKFIKGEKNGVQVY